MELAYWWMLPVSMLVASFATTVGVGGPVFFSPIFILIFGMPPQVAFGTALVTQCFGFGSGFYGYIRQKAVDFKLANTLLLGAIPFALAGTFLSTQTNSQLLELLFAAWVVISAAILYATAGQEHMLHLQPAQPVSESAAFLVAALGGLLVGLISTGMGNILLPWMNVHNQIPIKKAIATSVFVVFMSVLVSALAYMVFSSISWGMLLFTIPGVLIGGQLGPRISERMDPVLLKKAMSILFVIIGLAMFAKQAHLY